MPVVTDDLKKRLGEPIDTRTEAPMPSREDAPFVSTDEYSKPFNPPEATTPVPPLQQRAVPGARLTEAVDRISSRQESATIKKLRQAFGISGIPMNHFEYGGFKWSFRVPGKTDITWAVVVTGLNNPDVIEAYDEFKAKALRSTMINMTITTALMCISLAAIDDVPVHEHFGIEVDTRKITNVMRPPREVRQDAAQFMYDILADETVVDLTTALEDFYSETIDPKLREDERVANPLEGEPTSEST